MNEPNEEDSVIDRSGHQWWLKSGMTWGLLMWVAMSMLMPVCSGVEFSLRFVLINLLTCLIGGLFFGLGLKLIKTFLKPPIPTRELPNPKED